MPGLVNRLINEAGMWLLGRLRKGAAERHQGLGWDVDTILERMDDGMEKRFLVECVDLCPKRGHGCDSSEVPPSSSVIACPVLGNA